MGTFVEVTSPDKRAASIVFNEINRIESLLSKYKEDSQISRLNKLGVLENAYPETIYIIRKSREFWLATDGAFDITIGPLMDLWGFSNKKYVLPREEKIKEILKLVGSDKIILQDKDNVVKFKTLGMKIDLGAIAKGYAVDCAVKKLRKAGIKSCLINAGGDIYCLGENFGRPWRVAIQDPRKKGFLGYLELKDKAVATSGDYAQYFIKDQKRYTHILNPKTGYPADSGVVSVTVVADDTLTADALATAIFVLGKEKGEVLAKNFPRVETRIIEDKYVQGN
ncbi:MAG: FAD:protein FMN transferase [Candidatus Omnitrophica bacterium]|nr:FAD:protein FMN transferase [Candidatus Omnitrophota bacterium]